MMMLTDATADGCHARVRAPAYRSSGGHCHATGSACPGVTVPLVLFNASTTYVYYRFEVANIDHVHTTAEQLRLT
jgi:hypothetical protein